MMIWMKKKAAVLLCSSAILAYTVGGESLMGQEQPAKAPAAPAAGGVAYSVSPGEDLEAAVRRLQPGDTLVLRDGVYKGTIRPARSGAPGRPITIRAQNDGAATIDGEGRRTPVVIEVKDYIIIEGLVARNGPDQGGEGVFQIFKGSHNIIRRCTGYDAGKTQNCGVFGVSYPESKDNLLEDCAASGTGRKMFCFFMSERNTMRRCFANWQRWEGSYLNGANLQFYGANNCRMENCIAYGPVPAWWSVSMFVQDNVKSCIGNEILGTIAIRAGMDKDGKPMNYTTPRGMTPQGYKPSGLCISTSGGRENRDCAFRDCFSWGNLGPGLSVAGPVRNCVIDHVTVKGNGSNLQTDSAAGVTITNSSIEGTEHRGEGARLTHRYVDGKLTDQPLWPWPMEDRIKKEMGISVTEEITKIIGVRAETGKNKVIEVKTEQKSESKPPVANPAGNGTKTQIVSPAPATAPANAPETVAKGRLSAARIYIATDPARAKDLLRKIITDFPDTEAGKEARKELGKLN